MASRPGASESSLTRRWGLGELCGRGTPSPAGSSGTILRLVQRLHFTDAPWAVSRLPLVPPPASSSRRDPSPRAAESGDIGGVAGLFPWVEPGVGSVPGSTPNFPGIRRGKLHSPDGSLVYEKNFLFLKRATMAVGPSSRTEWDRSGSARATVEEVTWARRVLNPLTRTWPWRRWGPIPAEGGDG